MPFWFDAYIRLETPVALCISIESLAPANNEWQQILFIVNRTLESTHNDFPDEIIAFKFGKGKPLKKLVQSLLCLKINWAIGAIWDHCSFILTIFHPADCFSNGFFSTHMFYKSFTYKTLISSGKLLCADSKVQIQIYEHVNKSRWNHLWGKSVWEWKEKKTLKHVQTFWYRF